MAKRKSRRTTWAPTKKFDPRLYTVEVWILQGPVPEAFTKKHGNAMRSIQIRGDQTLAQLHKAIFTAFDREDEHMYEFQFGKGPHDAKGRRYVLPMALKDPFGEIPMVGDVNRTTIGSLGLKIGQSFGYWFDFGDDWYHQVDVAAIDKEAPKGRYPRVIRRVGESPPQYAEAE